MSPDLVLGRPVEGQDDARTAPRVKPRVSGVDVAREWRCSG